MKLTRWWVVCSWIQRWFPWITGRPVTAAPQRFALKSVDPLYKGTLTYDAVIEQHADTGIFKRERWNLQPTEFGFQRRCRGEVTKVATSSSFIQLQWWIIIKLERIILTHNSLFMYLWCCWFLWKFPSAPSQQNQLLLNELCWQRSSWERTMSWI